MATITSAASGNWSNTATWVGGVVPTPADDVVVANPHIVTLNVDVTIRTLSRSGSGGTLSITTSRTLTCTQPNGITFIGGNSAPTLVQIATSGITVNINSNIIQNATGSNIYGVTISAPCTVNIVGNITTPTAYSYPAESSAIFINAAATVNITGNIIGNSTGTLGLNFAIRAYGLCTINIVGNITSSSVGPTNYAIQNDTGACTINITGNCTAQAAPIINSNQAIILNFIGLITASSTRPAIIISNFLSEIRANTPIINNNGYMGISTTGKLFLYQAPISQWTFQNELNTSKILYSPGAALGNPTITDVRNGVTYADGALTGSLIIPPSSSVAVGVPVDNTVGTAIISITDMGALLASYNT